MRGFPFIFRLRIGKSARTLSTSYLVFSLEKSGAWRCMECPMTARVYESGEKALEILGVVMLFGATSSGSLLLTFWNEAVSTATCQVAFWKVELEAAAHFCFDIVDLGVA